MFDLCKYKDALGVAGDKTRPRLFGVRLQDVVFLIIVVLLFCYFTKNYFWKTLLFTLIVMLIVHRIFCVRTATDKIFFPNEKYTPILLTIYTIIGGFIMVKYKLIPFYQNN